MVAPDLANASRNSSGRSIIKWASIGSLVARRTASTTWGPKVRLGTKWPSMTSTWIRSAPAASASFTCSARRPMSAERIEGTISIRGITRVLYCFWAPPPHPLPCGEREELLSGPSPRPSPLWGEGGVAGGGSVDQPSCVRNHPGWGFAAPCQRHRLRLALPGRQDQHPARIPDRFERERHALRWWFGRVVDAHGQPVRLQRGMARKQRSDVPVLPHSQQHEIERGDVGHHLRVLVRALVRTQLGGDSVDGRGQHPIEQRLFRHAVVAVRVVRWHAALVAEKNGDPS